MNRRRLIEKYFNFFKEKNHTIIGSGSLIPENDSSVLFTTAGMHPLVPYLLGQLHPSGNRLVSVQKCIRTVDIDEVGDSTHHTFFEMLGNWSLGDYFKKEAIEWSFEFLTDVLKFPVERLAVSVFEGDNDAAVDTESAEIWESLGIPKERIAYLPKSENWWGPAGKTGPCGPDSEMFYWKSDEPVPEKFDVNDNNWVEIWNDVFMQYDKDDKGNYDLSSQKNIDTGMGVERVVAILNGLEDNYLGNAFLPIIQKIEEVSGKKYEDNKREMRIITDHIKASCFILAEGVIPSNKEQGYVLRRLIRRAIRYGRVLGMNIFVSKIAEPVFDIYEDYAELQENKINVLKELDLEEKRFLLTLERGLKIFEKLALEKKILSGKDAFLLYQSYGFPIEMVRELSKEKNIEIDEKGFERFLKEHQKLSKTASAGRFKSGLADDSVETTKLHTATHLLLAALRIVLKDNNIVQKGSNITKDRLRLDFLYPEKVTKDKLGEIENLVNAQIQEANEIKRREMPLELAKEQGILGVFEDKYAEEVSVYEIGEFSREICAGPHVKNTSELGCFKILKEESSSSGVRRIKAILE